MGRGIAIEVDYAFDWDFRSSAAHAVTVRCGEGMVPEERVRGHGPCLAAETR
jgi:hypothetical protein